MSTETPHPAAGRNLLGKVLGGGLPLIAASGIALLAPVLAYFWLPTSSYAVWVLGAAVLTLGTNLDFGGPAYVAAFGRAAPLAAHRRMIALAIAMSAAGAVVVTAAAILVWVTVGSVRQETSVQAGVAMLLLVAFAAICRSTTSVVAAYALAANTMRDRAILLVAGPVLQVIGVLVALTRPPSVVTLSIAVAIAGLPHLAMAWVVHHRARHRLGDGGHHQPPPFTPYAANRLGVSLCAMVLSQGDRWLAAAFIGTPEVVAALDIVQRACQPARLVLTSAGQALQAEFSRAAVDPAQGHAVLTRSERLVWKLSSPFVLGGWVAATVFVLSLDLPDLARWCLLAIPPLVCFEASSNVRTSYAIAIRRIQPELTSRLISVAATAVIVGVAVATNRLIVLVAAPIGFALGTAWYYWRIRTILVASESPAPTPASTGAA